jgi:hypothetical protein
MVSKPRVSRPFEQSVRGQRATADQESPVLRLDRAF